MGTMTSLIAPYLAKVAYYFTKERLSRYAENKIREQLERFIEQYFKQPLIKAVTQFFIQIIKDNWQQLYRYIDPKIGFKQAGEQRVINDEDDFG